VKYTFQKKKKGDVLDNTKKLACSAACVAEDWPRNEEYEEYILSGWGEIVLF
jgi:hypothetical protein